MAELDDFKNAVASLTTAVRDIVTELKAVADALLALRGQPTINPADVEAAAIQVQGLAANLEASVSQTKTDTGV